MHDRSEKPDIAIVGGGIAGLCLALGLINKGFDITIYEAAQRFGEIGAGVTFGPNAVRAMRLIDPRLVENLKKTKTSPQAADPNNDRSNVWCFRHAYHSTTGPGDFEPFGTLTDPSRSVMPVSRAGFLEELIKLVPAHTARFNKRVVAMEEKQDGSLELEFKDGTKARHSVVLGADGIRSEVRRFVLGPDSPNVQPLYSGHAGYRGKVPMDKAVDILGKDANVQLNFFLGEGSHFVCYVVDGGRFLSMTLMGREDAWEHEEWIVPSSREEMRAMFKGWPEKLLRLIDNVDHSKKWGLFHLPETETYYRGRTAVIGDAAHASTPFQGSGAGMAVEDAYVLSSILGEIKSPDQVEGAFAAYDAVRRPRTHKLVKTSAECAQIVNYQHPDTGSDIARVYENLSNRWKWIWEEDLQAEVETARKKF